MNEQQCLTAVMPCYNESATVEEILGLVLASPYIAEVVVVDDGSTDDTVAIVERVAAADARVKLVCQPFNMGKGAALQRGFLEVTQPYVIVQDADLEYDPSEYATVLAPLLDGRADVVFGSRFLTSGPHRVLYFWHSVGNRLLTLASNVMTNLNLTDMETCYKAFRREVLDSLTLEEPRFGIEPELTAKMAAGGWRIWEVGISYSGRTYAEGKKIGLKDAVRAGWCVMRYSPLGERMSRGRARRTAATGAVGQAPELAASLESLVDCDNYADWLASHLVPHLKGRVHEVGAGTGTISRRLARHGDLVTSEPDPTFAAALRDTLGDGVEVVEADLVDAVRTVPADTVVMVNVLEHIDDDVAALRLIRENLPPGGRLVLLVPAHDLLYSNADLAMGHHRRYSRTGLVNLVGSAGYHVLESRYVNTVGAALWFGYARMLGRQPTGQAASQLFDRVLVKSLRRLEDGRDLRFGQSVVLVAERI